MQKLSDRIQNIENEEIELAGAIRTKKNTRSQQHQVMWS